jgi:hypothetical protein
MDLLGKDLESDMLTLAAPLSREVGEGLPKVREFWWDFFFGGWKVAGPLL